MTLNVSGSASVEGPYSKPPKSRDKGDDEDDPGVTDTVATGRSASRARGGRGDALHERAEEGPDDRVLRG